MKMLMTEQIGELISDQLITREKFASQNVHYKLTSTCQCETPSNQSTSNLKS